MERTGYLWMMAGTGYLQVMAGTDYLWVMAGTGSGASTVRIPSCTKKNSLVYCNMYTIIHCII